ncbi:MAG: Leu/Ile/Val-binding protein precursor [bacterium ADurb.Bin429]|nr:MAG: Leu/Ile/Val-binding protein precursor [bacterium ADurb.Bin429]
MKRFQVSFMPALVVLAIVALAFAGVALVSSTAQAQKTAYKIGAIFDVTGPASPLGTPEQETVKMLVKQINAKGGIDGHPIEVIYYDNGSDEAKSVMAMKKLIEADKVVAIIGPSQTGTTLAGAKTIETAKVPLVSCAAGEAVDFQNRAERRACGEEGAGLLQNEALDPHRDYHRRECVWRLRKEAD